MATADGDACYLWEAQLLNQLVGDMGEVPVGLEPSPVGTSVGRSKDLLVVAAGVLGGIAR